MPDAVETRPPGMTLMHDAPTSNEGLFDDQLTPASQLLLLAIEEAAGIWADEVGSAGDNSYARVAAEAKRDTCHLVVSQLRRALPEVEKQARAR